MKSVLRSSVALIVYLLTAQCQAFIVKEILVHEPVTFLCTCPGNPSEVQWTRFLPIKATIATCHRQTCKIEPHCPKRIAVLGDTSRGNFSMTISSTAYNDAGSYRCTCDDDTVTEFKLKVYVPTVVTASEGQAVTLPCYGKMEQLKSVENVRWKKDGQKLLLYTHEDRAVTTEEASAGRFLVSEGVQDGDLSLHIGSVQQSDAGFYQCVFHNEAQEGEPRAVSLNVGDKFLLSENYFNQEKPKGPQLKTTTWERVAIPAAVVFVFIIVVVYIVRCSTKAHATKQSQSRNSL